MLFGGQEYSDPFNATVAKRRYRNGKLAPRTGLEWPKELLLEAPVN